MHRPLYSYFDREFTKHACQGNYRLFIRTSSLLRSFVQLTQHSVGWCHRRLPGLPPLIARDRRRVFFGHRSRRFWDCLLLSYVGNSYVIIIIDHACMVSAFQIAFINQSVPCIIKPQTIALPAAILDRATTCRWMLLVHVPSPCGASRARMHCNCNMLSIYYNFTFK